MLKSDANNTCEKCTLEEPAMKPLTCELCGSNDFLKQEGVFVCQSCKTKYSIEEAKKMLAEGTAEVPASISATEQKKLENLLSLAEIAAEGKDASGTVDLCGKILELDASNYRAYLLMAKSAGWESTLNNNKIEKAVAYARKAIALADENAKGLVAVDIWKCLKAQIYGLLKIALSLPMNTGSYIYHLMKQMETSIINLPELPLTTLETELKELQDLCSFSGSLPRSNSFEDRLPVFIKTGITLYNKGVPYYLELKALVISKKTEIDRIAKVKKAENDKIAKEASEMRYRDYWNAHPEQKASLEAEENSLVDQIASLNKEISNIPGSAEIASFKTKIQELMTEKSALGLFKGKEKKAIQDQIDAFTEEADAISKRMESIKADIQKKTALIKERLDMIREELTKAR